MNTNFGKLTDGNLTYAPDIIRVDGHDAICPSAEQYLKVGWLPIHIEVPAENVGVTYVPSGWEYSADHTAIQRVYTETPIVAPVNVYSVEEIIYGLIQKNALQAVKQIVGDYWELFTMRDTLAADNEIFVAKWDELKAAIVASGALTEEEIAAILKDAEVA